MKKIYLLFACIFVVSNFLSAQDSITEVEKAELLAKSPFNSVYPTSILKSADKYFEEAQMPLYSKGAIDEKMLTLLGLQYQLQQNVIIVFLITLQKLNV